MTFKTPNGQIIGNHISYCLQIKSESPELKIHVGTDSVYRSGTIWYIEVIVFRYGNSGAKYIYRKSSLPGFKKSDGKPDIFTKLWTEAKLTIALAKELREYLPVDVIEFDYNDLPEHLSNQLVHATKGWALAEGFCVMYKPEIFESPYTLIRDSYRPRTLLAAKAADHICQTI